jgi:hypothetical protein
MFGKKFVRKRKVVFHTYTFFAETRLCQLITGFHPLADQRQQGITSVPFLDIIIQIVIALRHDCICSTCSRNH